MEGRDPQKRLSEIARATRPERRLNSFLAREASTTEVWEIINLTADTHPMHTHLVQCQILNRQAFDVKGYPELNFPFDPFALNYSYVWHCHIVDHEDNEMMRPYSVMPVAEAMRDYVQGQDY